MKNFNVFLLVVFISNICCATRQPTSIAPEWKRAIQVLNHMLVNINEVPMIINFQDGLYEGAKFQGNIRPSDFNLPGCKLNQSNSPFISNINSDYSLVIKKYNIRRNKKSLQNTISYKMWIATVMHLGSPITDLSWTERGLPPAPREYSLPVPPPLPTVISFGELGISHELGEFLRTFDLKAELGL